MTTTIQSLIDLNAGKKFDVCLMNPPYGATGSNTIHLQFIDKCLNVVDKQVVVIPFTFITKTVKVFNKYKEKFSKYLKSVDEVDSKEFIGTSMPNVGIYIFDKDGSKDIKITKLNDENSQYINSLLDITEFNNYEKDIVKYLEKEGPQPILHDIGRLNKSKSWFANKTDEEIKEIIKEKAVKSCKKVKLYYDKHPNSYILIANRALGGPGNINYMSSKTGQILSSYDEILEFCISKNVAIGYNGLIFNSLKAAENCRDAMKRPLLQFCLYRIQKDQNLTRKVFRYIPDIDWSNPKVKTDEGLLELCGCPKDKAKEYAEYCKKIIEEVDKK